MLGAVLVSNLISQQFPKVSTPLVQIGLGIALALLPFFHFTVILDPELFLVLFIAPLLFEDAKKAEKPALWRLRHPIALLALGLVVATCLSVGFFINWFTPSIPLAAAFALAAALAPTDAVAVGSLKETATISADQDSLLKGESLFNDASSIVSFQFAIAAAVTGSFSVLDAGVSFIVMFLGGLVVGVGLMLLRYITARALRASGIEHITFYVLFEVLTPFLVFLVAEMLHVSGIIAVVAAGITYSYSPRHTTPSNARHNIVSTSVWSILSFSLNGLVFLILGTQLPRVVQSVWDSSGATHEFLVFFIVLILIAIILLRFVWVLAMNRNKQLAPQEQAADKPAVPNNRAALDALDNPAVLDGLDDLDDPALDPQAENPTFTLQELSEERREERRAKINEDRATRRANKRTQAQAERSQPGYWRNHIHDALVLSLTGVKGAITLALLLTLPLTLPSGTPFPERDLLLFLASGVIMLSLILANFLVPLVAPKKAQPLQPESEMQATLDIYRSVIHTLVEEMEPPSKAATDEVVRQYYSRINQLKQTNQLASPQEQKVRVRIIQWERAHTLELVDKGKVSTVVGTVYLYQLSQLLARVEHHNEVGWVVEGVFEQLVHRFKDARKFKKEHPDLPRMNRRTTAAELITLQAENYRFVLRKLDQLIAEPDAPIKAINLIVNDFQRRLSRLENPRLRAAGRPQLEAQVLEIETKALQHERAAIEHALEHGRISRATAKQLRDNVTLMELDIEEQLE